MALMLQQTNIPAFFCNLDMVSVSFFSPKIQDARHNKRATGEIFISVGEVAEGQEESRSRETQRQTGRRKY